MPSQIIALSGPRVCGKSTIANHLVNNHGYTRVAFADALREIAAVAGSDFINDRLYLARLGGKLRGQVPDFLLQVVKNRLESIVGHVVIEDIRFPAEVEFCQSIGATTIRFEISREEQLRRLENRDGKSSGDAEQLLDCMDENLLSQSDGWNLNIIAEGDFKELAQNLHQLCENRSSPLGMSYVLTQDSMETQEVV
jgi:dephospho-CoA kinase